MKLITISGLDGSGKSTQIQLLKNYLESQSKKVFYFHAIKFSLAKKISDFRRKYCPLCYLSGKCRTYQEKSVTQANRFQIFLRRIFLKIDLWRFKLLRNKLRNKSYDYILSDRYFYDSLINIEYLSDCHSGLDPESSQESGNNIIEPDLSLYLQVSPEIIMQRDRVPDQGLDYLKKKKELYENKISIWNMKTVDGNKDKNAISEEIKKLTQNA